MGLFVFNYFSEADSGDPWLLILARTLTQQLYVAFPSITYLLVNRFVVLRETGTGQFQGGSTGSSGVEGGFRLADIIDASLIQ